MAQKRSHDPLRTGSAIIDDLIHDELCTVVGKRLIDRGVVPTEEMVDLLANHEADRRTGCDMALAIGRLAVDGCGHVLTSMALEQQFQAIEEARSERARDVERIHLEMLRAHSLGRRGDLAAAVEELWNTRSGQRAMR